MRRPKTRLRRLVPAFLCAAALTAGAALAKDGAAERLRIVFIAYENPNQLLENVEPVVAYLEGKLGVTVEPFPATDYAAVVEALRHGTADAGFMGPLQYILANQEAGARPILGEIYNGSPTYVSNIFVRKDSGITKLSDLRGRPVAFVDPISSSGYMYPLDIFKTAGLIKDRRGADRFFKKIYFAGGDEQAIRAVFNRFVDAAGIGQYAYDLLRPDERDQIMTIGESKPIPSHCVVVRGDLDARLAEGLQAALLALNEGPNRGLLKNLYSVDGYVTVNHSTYQGVEDLAREFEFLRKRGHDENATR